MALVASRGANQLVRAILLTISKLRQTTEKTLLLYVQLLKAF